MGICGWKNAPGTFATGAVVMMMLLTGCATGQTPAPGNTPTGAASNPTPAVPDPGDAQTPTPAEAGPTSRLGLDCADLVPEGLAAETVSGGLVALPDAAVVLGTSPLSYAVEQLGGTACAATDPDAPQPVGGVGPMVPGYTVLVLPDATEQYAHYAQTYPGVTNGADAVYGDSSSGACFGRGAESQCTSSVLVGSTWIEVALRGIDVDAALTDSDVSARVAPLIESIVGTVAGAQAPGPLWEAPAGAVALPEDCEVHATAEEVRATFERTEELWVGPSGGGGWSLSAGAWEMSGAQRCSWLLAGSDSGVLGVEALPGGAWAYDAMTSLAASATSTDSTVGPIPGVERASFGCVASTVTCSLDTVIGGNWVQFSTSSAAEIQDVLRDRLVQTAAGAAARLVG